MFFCLNYHSTRPSYIININYDIYILLILLISMKTLYRITNLHTTKNIHNSNINIFSLSLWDEPFNKFLVTYKAQQHVVIFFYLFPNVNNFIFALKLIILLLLVSIVLSTLVVLLLFGEYRGIEFKVSPIELQIHKFID